MAGKIKQAELVLTESVAQTQTALAALDRVVEDEENAGGLPEGWIKTTLGHFTEYGKTKKIERKDVPDDLWLLELEDVEKNSSKILKRLSVSERAFKSTKNQFEKGAVLYGKLRPYLNKIVLAPEDGVCTTEIIPINVEPFGCNKYIFYWLKSAEFLGYVNKVSYGVNMPRLGTKDGLAAPLVLPPLAEQTVIAQTLDTLLAQVDNIKTRLDAIPKILKTFRQSVLAAAVSGKLTEEWREESKEKVKWIEVQFSELLEQLRSGSADTPNGDSSGVAILRSSAVRSMTIDYSDIKFLDSSVKLNESNFLRKGDLIFTRLSGSAEYVGNCALVGELSHSFQYPDRLFCARLIDQRHAKYLEYFFASNVFRLHVLGALKSSAGHQRITLDVIKKAIVTLPPIEEQTQIVHRVEELFAFADQIEQQVKNAQGRVNNLTQSILAKAFRGELTADWRGENPELITGENSAEALLIKIQAEREKLKPKKKSSVKKTTRKKTTAMKAS